MTGCYYSAWHGYSQRLASEVAELVDRASVTACNKQTDRRRAPIPSLRTEWGSAYCRSVNAVSSGRPAVWSTVHGRLDVLVFSLCVM